MQVLTLYHTIKLLTIQKKKPFENIVGKGENAGYQHFLLFLQRFLPIPKRICFLDTFLLSSANASNLDQSKNWLFGKELTEMKSRNIFSSKVGLILLILYRTTKF